MCVCVLCFCDMNKEIFEHKNKNMHVSFSCFLVGARLKSVALALIRYLFSLFQSLVFGFFVLFFFVFVSVFSVVMQKSLSAI